MVPVTFPGGKPVTAEPGLTPRLPLTTVAPVFVTVVPASTRKLAALPRGTGERVHEAANEALEVVPVLPGPPTVVARGTTLAEETDAVGTPWIRAIPVERSRTT